MRTCNCCGKVGLCKVVFGVFLCAACLCPAHKTDHSPEPADAPRAWEVSKPLAAAIRSGVGRFLLLAPKNDGTYRPIRPSFPPQGIAP